MQSLSFKIDNRETEEKKKEEEEKEFLHFIMSQAPGFLKVPSHYLMIPSHYI